MENLNKIVSFVLGLVVIIVFLAVITGRFKLQNKLPFLSKKATPTPTMTVRPTSLFPTGVMPTGTYNSYNKPNATTIPSTGAPTFLLPLLFSGLAVGAYLRKKT